MKNEIVGIDVSKTKLDAWLHQKQVHKSFSNNDSGFKKMIAWVTKFYPAFEEVLFCFEHTGLYSLALSIFLTGQNICYYQLSGLLVKRSLGLVRGKNDKVDAKNLARFLFLHQSELKPYQLPAPNILRLKQLLAFRTKLVRQCTAHKTYLRETKQIHPIEDSKFVLSTSKEMIRILNKKVKDTEKEIIELIGSEESLNQTHALICSIKGVGLIVSASMIALTNNFQAFKTWRKFACFAGIAPFEHQSGTSFRGKTKVSSLGNRSIKTLLSLAALTAVKCNPEMKLYYQRRLKEGKSKMSTINIIRNKLVSRMFAAVQRKSPWVEVYKFAA